MSTVQTFERKYPWTEKIGIHRLTFRLMTSADEQSMQSAVLKFANNLADSDLVFLRMDITQPEVVREWINNIRLGRTSTILVEEEGKVVGYGNLHYSPLQWTSHIGEIRVLVENTLRGSGVGRILVNELTQLARGKGLEKIVAHIPSTLPRVRHMFEGLGFEPSALLTDWLKDRNYKTHDLIIMARELEG